MKNQEEALHLHEESLKILREVLGSERSLKSAGVFISLADLHKKMGNYGKSLHLLESALEIYRGFLGTEHPLYGEVLDRLVVLYAAANRATDVLNCLQQITTISQRTISQVFSTGTEKVRLDYSATIRNEIDQFLSMALHFHRSPEIVHAALDLLLRRKAINLEVLAIQQDTVLKGKYPHLKLKLQELTVVRRNIAAKTLARLGEQDLAAHQQSLEKLERRRQMMESQLAREIPEMTLEHSLKNANIPNVSSALLTGTALVEFVRTEYCIFPKLSTQPNDWNKPARYLAFVLLAGEPDSVQMIDLGEAEAIDQMIAKFRVSITGEGENRNPENVLQELIQAAQTINVAQLRAAIFQPLQEYGWTKTEPIPFRKLTPVPKKLLQNVSTSIGYTLRKTLFDSLLKAIGDRKRLFLAPDGDLSKLPFEILPLDENRRLIDEYHISYLSSGRDVLRFQVATNHQPSEPLVFADPDFDLCVAKSTTATEKVEISGRHSQDLKRNTLYFQRLPGTRIEGEKIAERLGVKPLLEGKVLETSLKACCSPHILHLATHGFFLKNQKRDPQLENLEYLGNIDRLSGHGLENPLLRSGLALAGANTWLQGKSLPPEAEDGILTAEDVSGLDLLDTELVVLSACETGLGEICTGEGVFGLRRAFVLAGAKRLVMSLWQVPDQQTQELMTDFYERILKGQPCADALREAQLEIKKKYPNPLYWGAFICQGQPDSIHKVTVNVKGHRLMGKERQEAYVNLAHALLEFSDDNQAHELLSVNHELVDAGLVETMEQVSAKLKQEGDCKAANSLRTIAVQLAAALDNPLSAGTPVESLMLLTQLFRATVSSQGNHQVVFPLLEANLNKLDEHFAQFLKHWSAAALSTVHPSQSILIVHGLFTLGNLIQEFPSGDRVSNLEIAQVCDEIVQKCNREILEEAIRLDPYDPLPQRTLAEVLEAQGRYDEAARAYQETSRVLFRKAEAWLQLCRYDEGLQALDEVLALEPNNALALASRGETLRHLGRYQDAVVSYDKALEFKPDNDQHWYNKACCYALQNNIDLALENLEQAISLNPECLEIAKNDLDLLEVREDERFQKLMKRTTNE